MDALAFGSRASYGARWGEAIPDCAPQPCWGECYCAKQKAMVRCVCFAASARMSRCDENADRASLDNAKMLSRVDSFRSRESESISTLVGRSEYHSHQPIGRDRSRRCAIRGLPGSGHAVLSPCENERCRKQGDEHRPNAVERSSAVHNKLIPDMGISSSGPSRGGGAGGI